MIIVYGCVAEDETSFRNGCASVLNWSCKSNLFTANENLGPFNVSAQCIGVRIEATKLRKRTQIFYLLYAVYPNMWKHVKVMFWKNMQSVCIMSVWFGVQDQRRSKLLLLFKNAYYIKLTEEIFNAAGNTGCECCWKCRPHGAYETKREWC